MHKHRQKTCEQLANNPYFFGRSKQIPHVCVGSVGGSAEEVDGLSERGEESGLVELVFIDVVDKVS